MCAPDHLCGRVVMFRSILAWILTAAFLVTLPVTGAGYCPCRFVTVLRGPTPTATPARVTALPQPCKGCCHASQDDTPADAGDDRLPSPQPADAPNGKPCDHQFVLDAAPAGASGERSGAERGVCHADAVFGADSQPYSNLTPAFAASSDGPPSAPPTGRLLLRYAHAFRC